MSKKYTYNIYHNGIIITKVNSKKELSDTQVIDKALEEDLLLEDNKNFDKIKKSQITVEIKDLSV